MDYIDNGKIPIIEQGDNPIKGYSNDESNAFVNFKKVLLFGDHTTSLYKPTMKFILATDGLKIIKSKDDIDNNFIKVLLESNPVTSEGYKRHTKILKSKMFYTSLNKEENKIGILFERLDKNIDFNEHQQI